MTSGYSEGWKHGFWMGFGVAISIASAFVVLLWTVTR